MFDLLFGYFLGKKSGIIENHKGEILEDMNPDPRVFKERSVSELLYLARKDSNA